MTAYRCNDCEYIGEPDFHREIDKVDDGPVFTVVVKSCPSCSGEDLVEVALCLDCKAEGIDNEATHDDLCAEHRAEADTCAAEHQIDCRRDQNIEIRQLLKEQA